MNARQERRLLHMERDIAHGMAQAYARHMQSRHWQLTRSIRCLLALGLCEECGDVGREAHHVHYRTMGAWNEFAAVRWLCAECHGRKHRRKVKA